MTFVINKSRVGKIVNKLKEKILKNKIVSNFIILVSGDAFVSALNIISTAVIVNAIGLTLNGQILMIQTYALFFDQTFNFKSFQALIKYLSISLGKKDYHKSKVCIKQSLFLDMSTAIIAAIVGAMCVNLVIKLMGWDSNVRIFLLIYLITVVFNLSGTCIGILRIFNKFNYITYINMISAVIRIILFFVGLVSKLGFIYFFTVELINTVVKYTLYMIFAYKALKENDMADFYKVELKIDKSFFKFNLYSNITSTIDLPIGTLTTFIMNKYLGFEMISVYKIFEKIGSLLGRLSEPLNQIIYPELNNLIVNNGYKAARRLAKKLVLGIGGLGIVTLLGVVLTHKLWLWMLIPNYDIYIVSLYIYMTYIIFTNVTASIHSLFLAEGYINYTLYIVLCVNIVYCIIIIPIVKMFALNGVILALFIQAVLVISIKLLIMKYVKRPDIC